MSDSLAAFCLLFIVLGFTFLPVLGAVSYAEPEIVQHVIAGDASLGFLTTAEKSHMDDVHSLVQSGVAVLLFAIIFLFIYTTRRALTKKIAKQSFAVSLLLIILLIPFNYTFVWFHEVFFPQGNWAFPVDSWLITHFPPSAFIALAIWWFGSTVLLLGMLSRVLSK